MKLHTEFIQLYNTMPSFSDIISRIFEAEVPTPPPTPGGMPGLGGPGGGALPPPPPSMGGGGMGGLGGPGGGGLGGPGGPPTPGQSPPETKFIHIDDVWHALRGAVKDMDHYPDLKLKTSSKKKSQSDQKRKSSLETGE